MVRVLDETAEMVMASSTIEALQQIFVTNNNGNWYYKVKIESYSIGIVL